MKNYDRLYEISPKSPICSKCFFSRFIISFVMLSGLELILLPLWPVGTS